MSDYGLGIELKPSYWQTAVRNCRDMEAQITAPSLIPLDQALA